MTDTIQADYLSTFMLNDNTVKRVFVGNCLHLLDMHNPLCSFRTLRYKLEGLCESLIATSAQDTKSKLKFLFSRKNPIDFFTRYKIITANKIELVTSDKNYVAIALNGEINNVLFAIADYDILKEQFRLRFELVGEELKVNFQGKGINSRAENLLRGMLDTPTMNMFVHDHYDRATLAALAEKSEWQPMIVSLDLNDHLIAHPFEFKGFNDLNREIQTYFDSSGEISLG